VPAALAIVVAAFPVRERGRALAVFFAISGGLTAIGPIAGGFLTQWTWRAIFWVNIPVAIIALVLTAMAHIQAIRKPERIDWAGAAIVTAGMALSVLGFEQAPEWGWGSAKTILCIAGGLLLLVFFVLFELRQRTPLIKMQVFRGRAFVVDNLVLFFSMVAFVPVFFFASIYAQVSLGYNANNAGLYLLVIFAGFAPAAQIGGRMLDRGGARRPIILGAALATVGFALWANSITNLSLSAQWPYILLAGAGLGFIVGPASTDAVNRAIGASYGEVTGITQTIRNYGSALGVAILGTISSTVFLNRLTDSLVGFGLPEAQAHATASQAVNGDGGTSVSQAPPALQGQLNDAVMQDYAVATRAVLIGMAVALFVTWIVALAHPGGRTAAEPAAETADAAPESAPEATQP
jgi:MFS family permease